MLRSGLLYIWLILFAAFQSVAGVNAGTAMNFQQQVPAKIDSLKKPKIDVSKLPKAEIPKKPILKQLTDVIKFQENARKKEEARVKAVLKADSIVSSVPALKKLIDSLITDLTKNLTSSAQSATEASRSMSELNQKQFQMLLDSIVLINKRLQDNNEAPGSGGSGLKKPFKVTPEPDPNQQSIIDLITTLKEGLKDTQQDDEKIKARQERLKLLRTMYRKQDGRDTVIYKLDENSAVQTIRKLAHRKIGPDSIPADIVGFYPSGATYKSSSYNFHVLTSVAYESYEINSDGFPARDKNWNDGSIIPSAQEAGSKVFLTVTTKNSLETARFLTSQGAITNMINKTFELLQNRRADGIIIDLQGLNKTLRSNFKEFIGLLSKTYDARAKKSKPYQISIVLPVYDEVNAYDILSLDKFADKFLIDFRKKPSKFPGALAPLKDESNYSIEASVNRYLTVLPTAGKFMLCLSYKGVVAYMTDPDTKTEVIDDNPIPYKEIRSKYQYAPVTYDEKGTYASIETRDDEGNLTGHIYYDNEISLEEKYDFIINTGLGGVAIWQLEDDEGYGELWDALANKFLTVETVSSDTISLRPKTTLEYVKKNLISYYYALQDPCNHAYDDPEPLLLTIFNILLALLSIIVAATLVHQIRDKGENWKWKKTLMRILIVCVNLFIVTIFMWLYMDSSIPWFGKGDDCINIPFLSLLLIIFTGILLGSLIMRFLIFPALQRDEKP